MSLKQAIMNCVSGSVNEINSHRCLPHSMYIGTSEYYKEKLGNRLPEVEYDLMELKARPDLHKNDDFLNHLKKTTTNEYNKLMNELKEREEEGKDETVPEIAGTIFYAIENESNAHINNDLKSVLNIFSTLKLCDV